MQYRFTRPVAFAAGVLTAFSTAILPIGIDPAGAATENPFDGRLVNADPYHVARYQNQASSFRNVGDHTGADLMERMATRGSATWLGGWNSNVGSFVSQRINEAEQKDELATFVVYNIPGRDCGSYSAGGTTAAAYPGWINEISTGIGNRPAVLIIEPDALPGMDCLNWDGQNERLSLLGGAVNTFKANNPQAATYLDAGHPKWHSTATMADRLKRANVANARGFSLNVSNYVNNTENMVYGNAISALVGGKSYVVDTSRNGMDTYLDSTGYVWCNPPGRGVGVDPGTRNAAHPKLDAFVWAKVPGESDGTCNGGPSAGQWWPERARELADKAVPALHLRGDLVASGGATTTTSTSTTSTTTSTTPTTTTTTAAPTTTTTTAAPVTTTTISTSTSTTVAPTTDATICNRGKSCRNRK